MEAMSENKNPEREALDRLADALVDDILNASDEDILTEFQESYGDPGRNAEEMQAIFEKSILTANKRRLAAAKVGAAASRIKGSTGAALIDITEARRRLRAVLDNPEASKKLTMAARKESELSDADVLGMFEDLDELGGLPPDDNSGGKT
jgi:hypothetical protein